MAPELVSGLHELLTQPGGCFLNELRLPGAKKAKAKAPEGGDADGGAHRDFLWADGSSVHLRDLLLPWPPQRPLPQLERLQVLVLGRRGLCGPIPNELTACVSLQQLYGLGDRTALPPAPPFARAPRPMPLRGEGAGTGTGRGVVGEWRG